MWIFNEAHEKMMDFLNTVNLLKKYVLIHLEPTYSHWIQIALLD